MANIVSVADFVGEIYLPNTDKEYVSENLQRFISKYEKDFILKVFGNGFYNDLVDGLEIDPIPEKWTNIIDGVSDPVEFHGYEVYFTGIKQAIANYVYYWACRDRASSTIDMGEATPTVENAIIVTSAQKTVRAWNEMSDLIYNARIYVLSNPDVYDYKFPFRNHWGNWYIGRHGYCRGSLYGNYYGSFNLVVDYFGKINVNNI